MFHAATSASKLLPSWKVTPCLSLKIIVLASGCSHDPLLSGPGVGQLEAHQRVVHGLEAGHERLAGEVGIQARVGPVDGLDEGPTSLDGQCRLSQRGGRAERQLRQGRATHADEERASAERWKAQSLVHWAADFLK